MNEIILKYHFKLKSNKKILKANKLSECWPLALGSKQGNNITQKSLWLLAVKNKIRQ